MTQNDAEKKNHDKIATLRLGAESLMLSRDDHFFMPFFSASAVTLSCITRDIASSFCARSRESGSVGNDKSFASASDRKSK